MNFSLPPEKTTALRREWERAENLNKVAAELQRALIVPSINELRYAGRQIVDLLTFDSNVDERAAVLIDAAIAHCRRAQHDAIDVCLLYMNQSINKTISDFGFAIFLRYNPGLPNLKRLLDEATALIVSSRQRREEREEKYAILADILPALVDEFRALSTPIAAGLPANRIRRLSVVLSGAATLAAVVAVSLTLFPAISKSAAPAILSGATALISVILGFFFGRTGDQPSERPQ